jgi:phosphoribosylanthranilate isomerase
MVGDAHPTRPAANFLRERIKRTIRPMQRTRVKICGVMRVEDALAAARAGADAIGMVFYDKAKRCITTSEARAIVGALPPFVTPVALFCDESPQKVLDIAAELNIRHVQLQGEESADEVAEMPGVRLIKAIRVKRETISDQLKHWRTMIAKLNLANLAGFVLETADTGVPGGSGVANNWALVKELQARGEFEGLPSLIAAGGLTPETVGQVVREIRPWSVDVSSGVESEFGKKSVEKISAFVDAVARASCT